LVGVDQRREAIAGVLIATVPMMTTIDRDAPGDFLMSGNRSIWPEDAS